MRVWVGGPRILGARMGVSFGPEDFRRARLQAPTNHQSHGLRSCAFVYVIDDGRGGTKIGATSDPSQRIKNLQTASPTKLRFAFIGVTSGNAYDVEGGAHAFLDQHRLAGDWVDVSPEMAMAAVTGAAARLGQKLLPVDQARADHLVEVTTSSGQPAARQPSVLLGLVKGFAIGLVLLFLLCLAVSFAHAADPQDDVSFKQGDTQLQGTMIDRIGLTVKNISPATLSTVLVDCAKLVKGNVTFTSQTAFFNLRPNEEAYNKAEFDHTPDLNPTYKCRVSDVNRSP